MKKSRLLGAVCACSFLFAFTSSKAALVTVSDSFSPVLQVDNSSSSTTLNISAGSVPAGDTITDVNVSLNFTKCDDPILSDGTCSGTGASFPNEIVFSLTSPDGTLVSLIAAGTYTNSGAVGGTYSITFDDSASGVVGGSAPQSGTFQPIGSLSNFNSGSAIGTWTLFFEDTVGQDPMSLNSWQLDINTSTVPVPAAAWLFGSGLLGLIGIAKRKKA